MQMMPSSISITLIPPYRLHLIFLTSLDIVGDPNQLVKIYFFLFRPLGTRGRNEHPIEVKYLSSH